jgi:MFS family permease
MPTTAAVAIDELARKRKQRILAICCLSLFIVGLDITVVNVALPAVGQELDAGISGLQWTVSAFTLVMASLLMLAGSIADRFGRKRTSVAGLSVFSLASALCALAPSVEVLVVGPRVTGGGRLDGGIRRTASAGIALLGR